MANDRNHHAMTQDYCALLPNSMHSSSLMPGRWATRSQGHGRVRPRVQSNLTVYRYRRIFMTHRKGKSSLANSDIAELSKWAESHPSSMAHTPTNSRSAAQAVTSTHT